MREEEGKTTLREEKENKEESEGKYVKKEREKIREERRIEGTVEIQKRKEEGKNI